MIRTVMFDLDGTLVPLDYDRFLNGYIQAISLCVASFVEPRQFIRQLLASTETMVRSQNPAKTVRQVFWEDFEARIGLVDGLAPALDSFYADDFPSLRQTLEVVPHPKAREMIEGLLETGYDVVIATNPVFPMEAITERMRWGGVDGLPYAHVTSYETSHYCKPNIEYYEEILDRIGRSPEECMMVGNDCLEDMVAGDLGITTYLVEDFMLDRGPDRREPDMRGRFENLVQFVESPEFRAM
ncbi:MAG: HAD family hydrolase [Clostridia bacterium]|nr:HAD family hydrolase [Clostridia bacterium]